MSWLHVYSLSFTISILALADSVSGGKDKISLEEVPDCLNNNEPRDNTGPLRLKFVVFFTKVNTGRKVLMAGFQLRLTLSK